MRSLVHQLWHDDGGAIIAIEFILFAVIVLIGLIVGFVAVRNAVVSELTAMAEAVDGLGICYSFAGLSNCESSVCGSSVMTKNENHIQTFKTPAAFHSVINNNPCQ
jgi:Flp pilus assembly pilin Flp